MRTLLAAVLGMAGVAACDETFQPTEPSEVKFSVFGYLDAAADTQWIRVMPLRTLAVTTAEPLEARVTLENLRTGRVIELRDSVFRFGTPDVGSAGRFLHNFWTTERLEAGATYRFSAIPGVDDPSQATVQIPPDFETEVWIGQGAPAGLDFLRLSGLRYVAFVWRITEFYDRCGTFVERATIPYSSAEGEVQMGRVSPNPQARPGCGPLVVEKRDLLVAGSGAPWPVGRGFQTNRLGGPADSSSISGSVGFLGGVLSKTVPYETCVLVFSGPITEPCKLRYGAASATLAGRAADVLCGGGGVEGVFARLLELDVPPNTPARLRPLVGTRAGTFTFGALEAGKRYLLTLRRPHPVFGNEEFQEYADTLVFTPGERRAYLAPMKRAESCPTGQ